MPPNLASLLEAFEADCRVWYLVCRSKNYEGRQTLYARMQGVGMGEIVMAGECMDAIENRVRAEMGIENNKM